MRNMNEETTYRRRKGIKSEKKKVFVQVAESARKSMECFATSVGQKDNAVDRRGNIQKEKDTENISESAFQPVFVCTVAKRLFRVISFVNPVCKKEREL